MSKLKLFPILHHFLPLAAAITILSGLMHLGIQQEIRQSANDPQIQMAEDTSSFLSSGQEAKDLVPKQSVDISKSLSPFLIIYDDAGQIISSTAMLNDKTPELPKGVMDYTRQSGEDRFTWQPKAGVRVAVVLVHSKGGFVLAGRSLREVEIREDQLQREVILGWLAANLGALVILVGIDLLHHPKKRPN